MWPFVMMMCAVNVRLWDAMATIKVVNCRLIEGGDIYDNDRA